MAILGLVFLAILVLDGSLKRKAQDYAYISVVY